MYNLLMMVLLIGQINLVQPAVITEIKKVETAIQVTLNKEVEVKPLLETSTLDESYSKVVVEITGKNRKNLEGLVMGEAGNQGFIGAALVAQTIKDTMIADNCFDTMEIKKSHGYSAPVTKKPTQDVIDAVAYVFDEGNFAVKHTLKYFYAPKICRSRFHESQKFIVEYKDHRFFDRKVK